MQQLAKDAIHVSAIRDFQNHYAPNLTGGPSQFASIGHIVHSVIGSWSWNIVESG